MNVMSAGIEERRLGPFPWLVAGGPTVETFHCLGEHLRAEIREVVTMWPALDRLRRYTAGSPGARWLAAVRHATESGYPEIWAELTALAAGASVPLNDLALVNFRGDIGDTSPDTSDPAANEDGTGCSDLAWRRQRSFIAHNEDESEFFAGRCTLLTLAVDGRQPVTVFWKPGFLPSNTFTMTGSGLVWSIDHLPTRTPGPGPGRHFVARGLQLEAGTVNQAISYLREHPSAGGFAYTIGDQAGRIVGAESSAGQFVWREVGADGPIWWHTNHGRFVADAEPRPSGTSALRGRVLDALDVPAAEPEAGWFLNTLAGAPPPDGVRAEPSATLTTTTLCTFVADLSKREATILSRGADPVTLPIS
jgi:hypothetical protein